MVQEEGAEMAAGGILQGVGRGDEACIKMGGGWDGREFGNSGDEDEKSHWILLSLAAEAGVQRGHVAPHLWQNLALALWRWIKRNELKIDFAPPLPLHPKIPSVATAYYFGRCSGIELLSCLKVACFT